MQLDGAIERLEHAVSVCGSPDAGPAELRAALSATTEVQGFIAARRAELVRALDEHPASFPEATIAETSGCSLGEATKEKERSTTLDAAAAMADALSDGSITTGHVDALTRAARGLDESATDSLLGDDVALAAAAATQSIAEFDAFVKRKAKALDRSDAESRLDRQRRATRLSTWTDGDGMVNLRGRFDPDLGRSISRAIAGVRRSIDAGELPPTAPSDPIERSKHLDALAFAQLVTGAAPPAGGSCGPPLVVVDATQADGAGGPTIDWGLPIELPRSVLAEIFRTHDPDVVIVSNGVVLHAPGRLDLGRNSRLANRAQRRALQGLYATCAVPGCAVHYDRCKLHHVVWWRNGGRTDLANLLPVCQHHHTRIHEDGWEITLGSRRELTIRVPDGQVMRTGPPRRGAGPPTSGP
ncbi:MAG: HNH endonuclease [Actinomycetota bacterium]